MRYTSVSAEEFTSSAGVDDWRVVLSSIVATWRCASYSAAAELCAAIAAASDTAEHHPDIDLRYPGRVIVRMMTHAIGGLTSADIELARTISSLAVQAGAVVEMGHGQAVEVAIDTTDAATIRPFWAAVLGYVDRNGVLFDPLRIGPPMWFQQMDEPRRERGRFHIDVSVAHDEAEARIAAALAAGGRLVNDDNARSWWILADADGNEACICTWQDR